MVTQTAKQVSKGNYNFAADASPAAIETIYHQAYKLYQRKKYKESAEVFTLLTTLNPYVSLFWIGLGLSEQKNQQFETAIIAYDMASWADNADPTPYFYSADCFISLKGKQLALKALDKAIKLSDQRREYQQIKQEAVKKRSSLS